MNWTAAKIVYASVMTTWRQQRRVWEVSQIKIHWERDRKSHKNKMVPNMVTTVISLNEQKKRFETARLSEDETSRLVYKKKPPSNPKNGGSDKTWSSLSIHRELISHRIEPWRVLHVGVIVRHNFHRFRIFLERSFKLSR
ncbi:uncharacterized protein BDW47DRAFT_107223 [Aspergillus candidus]|uniref:Uncharacterized protein n=1 Tax=Aspergillus candidus TaxID=41067 RepID=A0A2I2F9H0_ASPCN|nr:hypothetical protein BDW47DRAFT_107223 [Aspergillus candidus]PLB37273.1 hypothetical protein BDW47DRAFT_107223 [Aspergillus candidus]